MKNPRARPAMPGPLVLASCLLWANASHTRAEPSPVALPRLSSHVFEWGGLRPIPKDNGTRWDVLDGPTSTLDRLHAHITTLNPGAQSGEPRRHLQEELIIVREGTIEAHFDGQTQKAGPGSVIFFAANAVTTLRNVGSTPATYTVVYYFTPLTPKP